MTLRRRLLLVVFGLAFVPIGLVGALAAGSAFQLAVRRAEVDLAERLATLSRLIGREAEVERLHLSGLVAQWSASVRTPMPLGEWLRGSPEVRARLSQPSGVTSRFVIVEDGGARCWIVEGRLAPYQTTVVSSRLDPEALPAGYRGLAAARLALRPTLLTCARPSGPALGLMVPYETRDGVTGIAIEELSVIPLVRQLLGQAALQDLETNYVAAQAEGETQWRYLYHSDPTRIGLPLAAKGAPDQLDARRESRRPPAASAADSGWRFARSRETLTAAGIQPQTGWLLGASLSLEPVFRPVRDQLRLLALLLLLMALLVTGGMLLVTRGIGGAVEEIASNAGAIARGDLERTIRIRRDDEFGTIAEAVNQMARDLVLTAEARSIARLSTRLTHDLKGVASQMNLLLHHLRSHYDDAEFRAEFVTLMKGLVEQIESLVLRLGHRDRERPCSQEEVDLAALIRDVLSHRTRAWPELSVREEFTGTSVVADPELLREVVDNLVANAAEAMNGAGQLVIRAGEVAPGRPRDGSGSHFLEVEDKGPGMSREFVEQELFRPFATTKPRGMGLGMYQVRQAITAMGGRIEVTSREGEGTRIRIEVGRVDLPGGGAARGKSA